MKRTVLLAVLVATSAHAVERWANGIDGIGRVSLGGGWKLAANDWFFTQSANAGYPTVSRGIGGPQATASFGYGATSWIEAAIDLFIGNDRFQIDGFDPINVLTYGALLGVRFTFMDFPIPGLAPYLGFGVGPTLGYASSNGPDQTVEKLTTGVAGSVGLMYRFGDRVGIQAEYRFLYARGNWVTSGLNVGGSWFSLSLVIFFGRTLSEAEQMLKQ